MLNFAQRTFRFSLKRSLSQASWIGALSALSLLSGWMPGLAKDFSVVEFSTAAYAQSATQVSHYAEAVLEMEPLRQKSYREVRRIMGGNVPDETCRQGGLSKPVKAICDRFFRESADIIQKNNLSINEFNEITQRAQSDPGLKSRIQKELIRQQKVGR